MIRRYGFSVLKPRGNFRRASSSLNAGATITSEPCFQFAGVATLYAYDPVADAWTSTTMTASDSWATLPPLPTPRHGLGVATLDDAIYVASGGPQPGATFSDALEIYRLP